MSELRLDPSVLEAFVTEVFERCGLAPVHARLVSDSLVQTSLRGIDSHGVLRVPSYVKALRTGLVDATATPVVVIEHGACAVMDAHNGLGAVAASAAMDYAVSLSGEYGIGCVLVRNSTHLGACGHYALQAAERGCIGLVWTNGPAVMPPAGGREARVGNNPLAIAAPTDTDPVLLDIAFSVVARGKVIKALAEGRETIPLGWMLDANGQPTTDAHQAVHGFGIPIGEHKGFGLAFMADVLAGAVAGSGIGRGVRSAEAQLSTTGAISPKLLPETTSYLGFGHICIALNLNSIGDSATILDRIGAYADDIRHSPADASGIIPRAPGDGSRQAREERAANGIPLSIAEFDQLTRTVRELEMTVPTNLVRSSVAGGTGS